MSDEKSPLDILMTIMRARFNAQDFDAAVSIAKAVAPFVHAKPRAQAAAVTIGSLRDQQLVELCRSRVAREGAAAQDSQ